MCIYTISVFNKKQKNKKEKEKKMLSTLG